MTLFFASILEADKDGSIHLPEKLRVLTWNYDIQLERPFYGFCDDEKMVVKNISLNDDRVYRMNGRCGTNPLGHVDTNWFRAYGSSDPKPWADGIRLYNAYMEQPATEPEIRFAWEDVVRTRFETTKLDLNEITTIVIIGYSFPYFNREIDDLIFKQFYHISKIYLQYLEAAHAAVEQRLEKLIPPDTKLVPIDARDLFYIPNNF